MEQDNRVLARSRARDVTIEEMKIVNGALGTQTVCTFEGGTLDGDVGEC
jgi:hypothetical protein